MDDRKTMFNSHYIVSNGIKATYLKNRLGFIGFIERNESKNES